MTEAEWLASVDPTPMLHYLQELQVSDRKLRLLACACCRQIWDHLLDPRSRLAVEVAERFADDQATPRELARVRGHALVAAAGSSWAAYWASNMKASGPLWNVFAAASAAPARQAAQQAHEQARQAQVWDDVQLASARDQVDLIRDLIGNPFRPVGIGDACLTWDDRMVGRLAEGIYQDRAFTLMPVLGDALEDAGCTDRRILEHCRLVGTHVRGCWVLDLILGKS